MLFPGGLQSGGRAQGVKARAGASQESRLPTNEASAGVQGEKKRPALSFSVSDTFSVLSSFGAAAPTPTCSHNQLPPTAMPPWPRQPDPPLPHTATTSSHHQHHRCMAESVPNGSDQYGNQVVQVQDRRARPCQPHYYPAPHSRVGSVRQPPAQQPGQAQAPSQSVPPLSAQSGSSSSGWTCVAPGEVHLNVLC